VGRILLLVGVILVLGGCGPGELTEADIERMGDAEAGALLECQMEQVYEEMGPAEGEEYFLKTFEDAMAEGGTVQVRLWGEGYTCPEHLP
jgi:hypothetical protein